MGGILFIDEYNKFVSNNIVHCINSGINTNNDYLILEIDELGIYGS